MQHDRPSFAHAGSSGVFAMLSAGRGDPSLARLLGLSGAIIALSAGSALVFVMNAFGSLSGIAGAFAIGTVTAITWAAAIRTYRYGRELDERVRAVIEAARGLDAGQPEAMGASSPQDRLETASWPERLDWLARRLHGHARTTRALNLERMQSMALLDRESDKRVHFFANLSHELRTPLNAILGYSSLLIEEAETREEDWMKEDLRRIRLSGRNLLWMIDDLLELSGLKSGRGAGETGPVDIETVVREAAGQASEDAGAGAAVTIVDETHGAAWIVADRQRLLRCLRNLIDHALERAGGGAVDIRIVERLCQPAVFAIDVRDHGPVVSEREQQGLAQDAAAGADVSHGPGSFQPRLAVARGIAGALHGSIDFIPVAEGGLVRSLALPRNADQPRTSAMTENSAEQLCRATSTEPEMNKTKTALVIDDDPAAVDLLSRWLERCGYRVTSAYSGEAGLDAARTHAPDIVLLDALMPGRSGYDLLPEMRAEPGMADTPILLVTVDDDRARGLDAGASDFVRKPVSEAELRQLLSVYDKNMQGDVLIIEDDDDAAEIMARNLRRLGFTTHRAADGAQGLEALDRISPRAIVLDLNMPHVNGFEFMEQIAARTAKANVPVLVVSGQNLTLVEHRKLVDAGCRFFLKGSSAPREIVATLREMVA
ncbi:MAG: response regulator [Novosphingobium sp.]